MRSQRAKICWVSQEEKNVRRKSKRKECRVVKQRRMQGSQEEKLWGSQGSHEEKPQGSQNSQEENCRVVKERQIYGQSKKQECRVQSRREECIVVKKIQVQGTRSTTKIYWVVKNR